MIKWHKCPEEFPEGEECIALYDVYGMQGYIPVKHRDRGVKEWVTLKEINETFGVNWTAEQHCKALN